MAAEGLVEQLLRNAAAGQYYAVEGILNQKPVLANVVGEDGWTPLHLAAHYGHTGIVQLLIAHGAKVNMRSQNNLNNTPIHAAAAGGHKCMEVIRLLLANGADINAVQHGGFTPLHAAAQNGDAEMVALMCERGADISARSDDGKDAAAFAQEQGHTGIVDWLQAREAESM